MGSWLHLDMPAEAKVKAKCRIWQGHHIIVYGHTVLIFDKDIDLI